MNWKLVLFVVIVLLAAAAAGWMWKRRAVKYIGVAKSVDSGNVDTFLVTDISGTAGSQEGDTASAASAQAAAVPGRACKVRFVPERNQIVDVPRLVYHHDDGNDESDGNDDATAALAVGVEEDAEVDDGGIEVSANLVLAGADRGSSDHEFNARRDAEIVKARMEHEVQLREHQFELVDETVAELDMVSEHERESGQRLSKN